MGKKILDSKVLYIVLSVILAVILWFYVTSLDGNYDTKSIHNIPVTFVGTDILEERGLMIIGSTPTASVQVRATPLVLAKLTDDSVTLTVNVSQITEASEYTLAYTASLPSGVSQSQAEFVSGGTGNVTFTVVRYTSREIPIFGQFTGNAAEGYIPGDEDEFIFAPKTLTISGQADLVNQVDHALVTLSGEDLTETISDYFSYQLIGVNDEPLEDLDVTCSEESIYVTYPIWATAEINLEVKFVAGGGVSAETVKYTMSTDHITVAGTKDAIASITDNTITVATINLAAVNDGDELRYTIPLSDELRNLSGVTEIVITIELDPNLVKETMEITEIACINLPEGWRATVVTQVLPVVVRGTETLMNDLTTENLRVVVDLSEITLAPGQYTVPVKIYIDSVGSIGQIGYVGTDYKVVVALSKS